MKKPGIPPDEQARLAALQAYQVLDTLPEQDFDDLTLLASRICDVPMALVSLVDSDRQWFKSRVGLDAEQTARDISFCGHVVADREMLIVEDATADPRFADNPLVTLAPDIRFYAGAPLVTPDDHYIGTLCVIDRTPRGLTEEQREALQALSRQVVSQLELRAAMRQAQAANMAKSTFLANMSHELRTPLNSVIGFTNILMKNKAQNLRTQDLDYLDRVADNGRHLLSLINDILDLSRIEAGRMPFDTEEIDLRGLIEDVAASCEAQAQSNEVRLSVELPDNTLTPAEGDPRRLRQVITNLVGNAIKFAPGRAVEVRVVATERDPIRIDVADAGDGIPSAKLENIFEAFRQADDTTSRKHGGTGLGLTISRSLCLAMGWDLGVVSEVGVGSTFSVVLKEGGPALVHRPPSVGAQALPRTNDRVEVRDAPQVVTGQTVLVIDDEPDSRLLMERCAAELGFRVVAVDSGARGVELARSIQPALITLDLMMPGFDGFSVLKTLKEEPSTEHIPVVVCSIVGEESRASLAGDVQVLDKPVGEESLSEVLKKFAAGGSKSVLIVEDDAYSRELLGDIVGAMGMRARLAKNGEDGLVALAAEKPHLVIVDLMMPVLDGFGFIQQLRARPGCSDIPVVICTAKDLDQRERENLERDAHQIVTKGEALEQQLRLIMQNVLLEHT